MSFQSFELNTDPTTCAPRMRALRHRLRADALDGFLVPRADRHQGEYVPACDERLAWLTGFSGSAGTAIVLTRKAALFTDGRYLLQASHQVDKALFDVLDSSDTSPADWLRAGIKAGHRIGFDPWLHTVREIEILSKVCAAVNAELIATATNPLDAIWDDCPAPPRAAVSLHPLKYAGTAAAEKLDKIKLSLKKADQDATVLTLPDSICWLFNIRGRDLPHTPVVLAFAIVPVRGKPHLFIDRAKLSGPVRSYLSSIARLRAPEAFETALGELGAKLKTVGLDPARAAHAIAAKLEASGATIKHAPDPCLLPKALKTAAEIRGAEAAHRRDGAALSRFLAWLDAEAPGGRVSEIDAAKKLEEFRRETGKLCDLSFDTISGAGANGAIVHYRVTRQSNRKLKAGTLYLVDSGGQYLDGTTDITRTVAIGAPDDEMRRHFTLVLKGHIALAAARFPEGTSGAQLDALARMPLWREGLDYDHGTGHGVGSFLSVHEGPQGISKRASQTALAPGMIVSNEPGYYRTGHYGIRIENLVLVKKSPAAGRGKRPMLGFKTLSLAPIDRALIEADLLTGDERSWLDAYHARVFEVIAPLVNAAERKWLAAATAAL